MFPLLKARKDWCSLAEYLEHLDSLPPGPNITSFVGHLIYGCTFGL